LEGRRADYGEEVLPTLAAQLVKDYGSSFAVKNLRRMVQFANTFPQEQIVVSLSRQLSWTHFIALIPLKDPLQRQYYVQMASAERWSVRMLRDTWQEGDLEAAIIREMESFLLELWCGFERASLLRKEFADPAAVRAGERHLVQFGEGKPFVVFGQRAVRRISGVDVLGDLVAGDAAFFRQ